MVLSIQGRRPRNPKIHTIKHVPTYLEKTTHRAQAFSHLVLERGGYTLYKIQEPRQPTFVLAYVTNTEPRNFFFKSISAAASPRKTHARPGFLLWF